MTELELDPRYRQLVGSATRIDRATLEPDPAGDAIRYRLSILGIGLVNIIELKRPPASHTRALDRMVEELDAKLAQLGYYPGGAM